MGYRGLHADTVSFRGHKDDLTEGYHAYPLGEAKVGGVVIIHHRYGWDEWIIEATRKLAHHGFAAISPNLCFRDDPWTPEEKRAVRSPGGRVPDDQMCGDVAGAMRYLRAQPNANGKVGIIGFAYGGVQAYVAACTVPGMDAAVNCWGGYVITDDPADLIRLGRPKAPIDLTATLGCPMLGVYGADDPSQSPDRRNRIEDAMRRYGKIYEAFVAEGAGHDFFWVSDVRYRPLQAVDGWKRVNAFFERHLGAG